MNQFGARRLKGRKPLAHLCNRLFVSPLLDRGAVWLSLDAALPLPAQ
jgi:hypothetical protein